MLDLRIQGGRVIDPANGIDQEPRDLWISGGKIVDVPTNPDTKASRTLDVRGRVVMPGGVDVHCHIVGGKVNAARALRPEEARKGQVTRQHGKRSGTVGCTPSTFATGYLYTGLGYTTALDAAIPPMGARHAHHEFADTPLLDKAFLVLMGNNHLLMDQVKACDADRLRDCVAWLLEATRGYGVKVVNPGGIEKWKQGRGNVTTIDDEIDGFGITPRSIMTSIARAVDELGLPHPMHLHGLNLGLPGNAATTLETLHALDGHRVHMAHIQFHSYGKARGRSGAFDSGVAELVDYVNNHERVSLDVGQILFGETTSMTADGPVGEFLARVTGRKWVSQDVELETGCGVVPITYSDRNTVHALQWSIGLEWFLRVDDPWKIAISTDHPNGGSFLAYPRLIALLMDRSRRNDALNALPEKARKWCALAELSREYTLNEIAIITRAAPARMLGLRDKGHLGPGADADITIYDPNDDKERMFSSPRYVLKAGEVVVDDGELRQSPSGRTFLVAPEFDRAITPSVESWFARDSSIQLANFEIPLEAVANPSAWTRPE
jgi:formylmethanofuran dehydrogenase subunit A